MKEDNLKMAYKKVEGGYRSVKAQNQRRGNNQPVILYERNLDTLMAMYDYAASHLRIYSELFK